MKKRKIWLADHRGRNAVVALVPRHRNREMKYADTNGLSVSFSRIIKNTQDTGWESLCTKFGDPELVARALVTGDPEVDMESVGRKTGPCDRVYVDGQGKPLYSARPMEVLCDRDGVETARRDPVDVPANLVPDSPHVWSGKLFSQEEIVRKYAITRAFQVQHTNALEFGFLYGLATYLEQHDGLVLVGSGPRGTGPLVTERNATPMKAFLGGRTSNDKYLLILHLASFELRAHLEAP